MAKDKGQQDTPRRQTRKEFMLTRQQQEQYQKIKLAVIGLVGLLALVLIAGLAFEFAIKPGQPVATVNGEDIKLADWQRRTGYERLEGIENIESFYDLVDGNVGQLQQFAGQQLTALVYPSVLGEQTLNTMINEILVKQEANNRNITVSDAEIDERIERDFDYYDGGLPTATPSPTETPVPTPSVTPIQIGDEPIEEPIVAPELTPEPDVQPTAVSAEAFQLAYDEALADYGSSGATEADFRASISAQLYQEKLQAAFGDDAELVTEEESVDFFMIQFNDQAEADAVGAQIESGEVDFITAWNTVRSSELLTTTTGSANDYQWTPLNAISTSLGTEVSDVMSTIAIDEPSGVLAGQNGGFFIVQIRDREMRALGEDAIDNQRAGFLLEWLEEQRLDVTIYDRWSDNVPDRPILDPKYFTEQEQPPVDDASITTDQ